ncbi:MAG: flagellar hook-basal body complex protein FliE [Candidatus Gastranaerophilaceae bacterium]
MEINAYNPNLSGLQTQFNPIKNYNNFLKGNASFEVNNDFQMDFDRVLQKEIEESSASTQSKLNKMSSSPVQMFMNSIENGISNGLNDVNEKKLYSDELQEAFARGEDVSVHDLMIAAEKSTLSMQLAMQIRNRMISAYNDVKNMSL